MLKLSYIDTLKKIYNPPVGSIWKAPNFIWTTNFARNKDQYGLHPSIVERVRIDRIANLAPGTSKKRIGSCVFKADMGESGKTSYFLLDLSMPITLEQLLEFEKGWNNVEELSDKQLKSFLQQIKFCKG